MLRKILITIVLLFSGAVFATPVALSGSSHWQLNPHLRYHEDPQGRLTLAEVRSDTMEWQQNGESAFNKGYSASVWWLNLTVQNNNDTSALRYLELSYAVLDYVDVFIYSGSEQLASYQLGDLYPFSARPIENRFFVVPLQWQPGQVLDIYYRIKTSTSVQAPLALWTRDAFEKRQNNSNIAQGFYYGAMVIIAVYNLLIFLVLWERSYLYYVLFVLSLPGFMAAISGHAYHYVWPNAVSWNDHSIPFFLGLAFASSSLFARRFLQVQQWSPWLYKGLTFVAVSAGACVAMSFVVPYYVAIHLLVPLGLFACVFELTVGVMALRNKVHNARYYVVAWGAFLCGGMLLALNKLNVIPTNGFTEYAMQFGSLLEAVLLSFAMAERINVERRLRFEAQEDSLRVTRRLNEELEARVQMRTEELEKANQQLKELSTTDQLTQLRNRRFMEDAMKEEWARCQRYKHEISIMMMDVDLFKRVNDEYGHPAGDACLQQVAERIRGAMRWPSDKVARYGGEEFCMVLPETGAEGAFVVADRIRRAVESSPIIDGDLEFNVTLSVGVAAGLPSNSLDVDLLLKQADLALYQSKEAGRNKVTVFDDLDNKITPISFEQKKEG